MKHAGKIVIAAVLTAFLSGCVVVSLNPLFTETDLIPYPDLVGTWKAEGGTWTFSADGNAYKLAHQDDQNRKASFKVSVGKIGTNIFVDFLVADVDDSALNQLAAVHLIAGHTFAKLSKAGDDLRLIALNPDWVRNQLKDNPKLIPHVLQEDRPILTGTTAELKRFTLRIAENTNAFSGEMLLKRVK